MDKARRDALTYQVIVISEVCGLAAVGHVSLHPVVLVLLLVVVAPLVAVAVGLAALEQPAIVSGRH